MWLKRVELDESFCGQMDELLDQQERRRQRQHHPGEDLAPSSRQHSDENSDENSDDDNDDSTDFARSRKWSLKESKGSKGSKDGAGERRRTTSSSSSTSRPAEAAAAASWAHSLASRLLLVSCKFSHVKLNTSQLAYECGPEGPPGSSSGSSSGTTPTKSGGLGRWWPHLVSLVYVASSVSLALAVYYHYVHDQYAFHLRRLRQARDSGQAHILADYRRLNVSEHELELRLLEARDWLRPLGAPYLGATYAPECCYLFLLINTFAIYVLLNGYVNWLRPIDCHLFRFLLDRRAERKNFNRLICAECNKYIQSACNFTEASIKRCIQLNGYHSFKLERLAANSELRRLLLDYKHTIGRLRALALAGSLQPPNKTDAYLEALGHGYLAVVALLVAAGALTALLALLVIPRASRFRAGATPSDLVAQLELAWLWAMVCLEAVVYVSFTLLNSLDQSLLIGRLIGEVQRCIGANTRLFYENFVILHDWRRALEAEAEAPADSSKVGAGSCEQKSEQQQQEDRSKSEVELASLAAAARAQQRQRRQVAAMNRNLLFVLLHYKIFAAKLRPIQKSFGVICLAALVITFSLPLLTRLHVPYMSAGVKLYIVAVGTGVIMLTNICVAPVCLLNVQCLKLYRRLWTMLAHTIDVTSNSQLVRVYDKHTVWMLRKELHHPDRLVDQFATSALGLNFTYSNLIRIHFWYGLIILSILTDVRSDQEEIVGSLTNDPLGIFNLKLTD